MMLKALIVEQLEADGTIRSFKMQPSQNGRDLVVAFPDEYEERRVGPFHFLDPKDARRYSDGFAKCNTRKIGSRYFYRDGPNFHVETGWAGIPTEKHWLSYYALSLPEHGIPVRLAITDPHSGREYKRRVTRDDQHERYVIFLECVSSIGRCDFDLSCDFSIAPDRFSSSDYRDHKTEEWKSLGDDWRHWLSDNERNRVQQFFVGNIHMRDSYSAGQAGAMGPNAHAHNITFQQIWDQSRGDIDLGSLARELAQLRQAISGEIDTAEKAVALGEVASAETSASKGDGPTVLRHLKNAGQWVLQAAQKIGLQVATKAIENALGMHADA